MTNTEAIRWLQLDIDMTKFDPSTGEEAYLNDDTKKTLEALDMAIAALRATSLDELPNQEEITCLSELRASYSCFDAKEEPFYRALSKGIEALRKSLYPVDLMRNEQKNEKSLLKSDPDSVSKGDAVYRQLATILCSRIAQTEPKTSDSGSIDSEKPEIKTNRTTDDTISRQAAIDAFEMFGEYESNRTNKDWVRLIKVVLSDLASAQPEIVRCGDCKYYREYGYINGKSKFLPRCAFSSIYVNAVDFCSKAERR